MSNGGYGRSASSRQPWSTSRDHLDAVAKLVGVSDDFERLAACEPVARIALEDRVSIALAGQRDVAIARMVVAPTQLEMPDEILPAVRNADETGRAGEERCRTRNRGLARPSAERPPHYGHGCKPPQSVFFQEVDSGLTIPMPFIPTARLGRRPAAARPPWNG